MFLTLRSFSNNSKTPFSKSGSNFTNSDNSSVTSIQKHRCQTRPKINSEEDEIWEDLRFSIDHLNAEFYNENNPVSTLMKGMQKRVLIRNRLKQKF